MSVERNIGFESPVTIQGFRDASGNPTTVDARVPIEWHTSDETRAIIVPDPANPQGGFFRPIAPTAPGETIGYSFKADVDRGDGVKQTTFVAVEADGVTPQLVTIPAGEAVAAVVTMGAEQPVA